MDGRSRWEDSGRTNGETEGGAQPTEGQEDEEDEEGVRSPEPSHSSSARTRTWHGNEEAPEWMAAGVSPPEEVEGEKKELIKNCSPKYIIGNISNNKERN